MPTRTQRARQLQQRQQHQQRRRPSVAETLPVIVEGRKGLRRFSDACDAYETDMDAAFTDRTDAIAEAWADYQRKAAAAEAEYERAAAAAGTAYEQRTADSHAPEPDGSDEPDETDVAP